MERLDQNYLNQLVRRAQTENSNAFAELFAAAYERHARYLGFMLKDPERVQNAMRDVYVQIVHNLPRLHHPALYLPWSMQICLKHCLHHENLYGQEWEEQTTSGPAGLLQMVHLPLTESQILIMHYVQGIPGREIGLLLNCDRTIVKRCIKNGLKHLQRGSGERVKEQSVMPESTHPVLKDGKQNPTSRALMDVVPDSFAAAGILEHVFDACGREPNTVPLEALSSYTVYRKERFSLQRGILIAAIIVFLLLPLLFLLPDYEVDAVEKGERGLPVYSIHVHSLLPVGKVTAKINHRSLPVYEANADLYTVEPIRNGNLTVEVALINRQSLTSEIDVKEVDAKGPELTESRVEDNAVLLSVHDSGIGVDYREVYAISTSGEVYHPLSVDEEKGEIVFTYPEETWDVYIPDHIGNTLHLSFTFT